MVVGGYLRYERRRHLARPRDAITDRVRLHLCGVLVPSTILYTLFSGMAIP